MSHSHDDMAPRGALMLAGALVVISLLAVSAARLTGQPLTASPTALRAETRVAPVASRDLRFLDQADGSVRILDVADGRPVGGVAAGSESGFIRGVMRGLARERRMHGFDAQPAFRLTLWADGELSLHDLATGRTIELGAFGATNRAAFMALLPKGAA
ncbi:photosynthetic complex assembly protein PuhC [Sphingomonas sp. 1P06PA]|uniref:photosynthetic complex assembly protein PuhC n=1 Tax=Sphingomonas sp. 1P06PA TaxID=554121 RepID=UPI0039A53867